MSKVPETPENSSDEPLLTSVATSSGICLLRDGRTKLSYEIHGSGPEKLVLIMGLLASRFSWRETLNHFMSKPGNNYSILIFDNRGVGRSDAPWGRYTTSMLAADVLDLVDHIGWNQERSVHVNGVSMGGMIALEFALLAGSKIRSLTLTSTCAKHQNPPRTRAESAMGWINFFRPKPSNHSKVTNMLNTLFVDETWLKEVRPDGQTNRDRIYDIMMTRAQKQPAPGLSGQMGQIAACLTHECSAASLAKLGEIIPDLLIITGDKDKLIDPKCSDEIYNETSLRGERKSIKKVVYAGKGHALAAEAEVEYHKEFEAIMSAGNTRWK